MIRPKFAAIILLLVTLLFIVLFQHRAQLRLRAENSVLHEQLARLSETENPPISKLAADGLESSLPDAQFRELLRLRGEIALLRNQQKEAQAQSDKSKQSSAQSELPASATFSPGGKLITTNSDGSVHVWDLADAQEVLPKDKWTFAGYADPESTLKTLTWAMSRGDLTNMLASVTPEEGANINKDLGGKSEAEIASELSDIAGVRIIKKEVVSDDQVVMTLFADGKDEIVRLKFQRFGTEWKMAGKAPHK